MTKTIQYDINEVFRGCLRKIYKEFRQKSEKNNIKINEIGFTKEEIKKFVEDEYLRSNRDPEDKSKIGILAQLKIYLQEKKFKEDNKIKIYYYLKPALNLLRTKDRKVENEVLYVGLLEYSDIFKAINKLIYKLLGIRIVLTENKETFMQKISELMKETENKELKLSASTIITNSKRSIENMIRFGIILDSSKDRSLEKDQIRIKNYVPDFRILLILYLQEVKEKRHQMPSMETLFKEYNFIRYFFLNKDKLKETLDPALKRNIFTYQQQIGDAIKVNYNEWELSNL